MLRIMINGLSRFFQFSIGAEWMTSVGISVKPGKITAGYLDPNLVTRQKDIAGNP